MNRLPFLGLLFALLCLVACRQMNEAHLLHLAEKQVNMNVDSVYALLVQIERPSQLSDEERLLYGWLNAYVHYKRHNSMAEDSLILPASDYYVFRNDTAKNLFSYQLKAWYWYWLKEHERCIAAIDSGVALAKALQDTGRMADMLIDKAYWYVYVWKDYEKAIETFRTAIALDARAGSFFSMGIAMGLNKNDSASYYMERSIELAVEAEDTSKIVHYLRNYTDAAHEALAGVDTLLLEANHDVETLQYGPYPYFLKRRILGDEGHLSNDAAAEFARLAVQSGTRDILLAHLSKENNTPELAEYAVARALQSAGLSVRLGVAPRDTMSEVHLCRRSPSFASAN